MSPQYGELRPTSGWDRLTSLGYPCKFQLVSRLGSVTARHLLVGVSQTLRRWTEDATYIRQGDHHVGHWPTFLVSFEFFRGSRKYVIWVPPSDTILFIDACNDPARRNIQPLRIKCNRNENSFHFDTAVTVRSHEMKLGLVFCLTVFSPYKASFCSDLVLCFAAQNLSTLLLNQLLLHCSN